MRREGPHPEAQRVAARDRCYSHGGPYPERRQPVDPLNPNSIMPWLSTALLCRVVSVPRLETVVSACPSTIVSLPAGGDPDACGGCARFAPPPQSS